jgi:hypothetical protein
VRPDEFDNQYGPLFGCNCEQAMSPESELEQKAFRTKIRYRFFGDHVEYAIGDTNFNKTSFSTKYTDLPSKFDYRPARTRW